MHDYVRFSQVEDTVAIRAETLTNAIYFDIRGPPL